MNGVAPQSQRQLSTERSTVLLQAAAALLIANSHLEGLYPEHWMAADGFIGNSIFFLLSGYGITLSLIHKEQSFPVYYWRRILRIYPVVWLVQVVFYFVLLGKWRESMPGDYLSALVYPTEYGYVCQIMVFYVLLYLLKRWLSRQTLFWVLWALFLPLFGFFWSDFQSLKIERLTLGATHPWLWWVFFFQVMLLGGWLAVHGKGREEREERRTERWERGEVRVESGGMRRVVRALRSPFLLLPVLFGIYVGLKFLMVFGVSVPVLHVSIGRFYLLLHFIMLPLLVCAFRVGTSGAVMGWLQRVPPLWRAVALVGGLTLEVYTVHRFIFENGLVRGLGFPLNVILFFVLTIVASLFVSMVAGRLRSGLEAGAFLIWPRLRPKASS